jgi:hypothetical protein
MLRDLTALDKLDEHLAAASDGALAQLEEDALCADGECGEHVCAPHAVLAPLKSARRHRLFSCPKNLRSRFSSCSSGRRHVW